MPGRITQTVLLLQDSKLLAGELTWNPGGQQQPTNMKARLKVHEC